MEGQICVQTPVCPFFDNNNMANSKTYIAASGISINVKLASGHAKHICFDMQSNGTSIYSTDKAVIIEALENDSRFGSLYKEMSMPKAAAQSAPVGEEKKPKIKEVEVECLADAKEYLAQECGVPRSIMRSKTAILTAAKENDIVFKGSLD